MTESPVWLPPDRAWPVELCSYDRAPDLSAAEESALGLYAGSRKLFTKVQTKRFHARLERLVRPLQDVMNLMAPCTARRTETVNAVLREVYRRHQVYWGWKTQDWIEVLKGSTGRRPLYMGVAYLLGGFVDFPAVDDRVFAQHKFATKIFGCEAVEMAVGRVQSKLREWGYADVMVTASVPRTVCEAILANRSPRLEEFSREVLEELRKKHLAISVNRCLVAVSEVLTDLGIFKEPLAADKVRGVAAHPHILQSVPAEWARICDCWRATSTRGRRTRIGGYYWLLCVGRWLGREHPEAISPAAWTRELAAEYVAVVCCLKIGDWAERLNQVGSSKIGKPIAAGTIHYRIDILGAFFSDLQEWDKIPRRFDPRRCLRTPRSVLMQLGPRPRVVADDIWAKLLWAGLNLTEDDLPRCRFTRRDDGRTSFYPLTMVRALVVVLLFSGLRRDEIRRLRVGCVRWQPSTAEAEQNQGKSAICLLDIPVNKTSPPFTKPVDRVVGEAIAAWEQERPVQPKRLDAKTGESVSFLFLYRGRRIGPEYLKSA